MILTPTLPERLARARSDLRMGLPVVLRRGAACLLAAAPETLHPDRFANLIAGGAAYLALTHRRAETLKTPVYDGDITRIEIPTTMNLSRLRAILDPADDLRAPMKGPFRPVRTGDPAPARTAIAILKSARLLPGALMVPCADPPGDLTVIDMDDPTLDLIGDAAVKPVVAARLPLAVSTAARLHIFRPDDGGEEHYAVEIGKPDRDGPVLARLHSACFTGDVLGSLKCDCGPQLNGALAQMAQEGGGILLYLNQEGRGIGLTNKMRAYSLQDQGFDTVEANHRLGFEDDERDFRIGAHMLTALGIDKVRLLTNNPRKVEMLATHGLTVTERVPLHIGENPLNAAYLRTKAAKSGHLL
ncbi:GTP cyclohydrolase II [Oceaniglobus ichthyenteri]|uniref:GTP cyclohydrolase II n=1 Tax=Oceaniglobus ichthyenteri TaxID=2136177 RepID=UPI000D3470A6|nr:GTP cyclohydrolase II [Oceaniglobus ichthyenteri]